jgi:hypothetical protein
MHVGRRRRRMYLHRMVREFDTRFVRSEILNGPSQQAIRAEGTAGEITAEACAVKGRVFKYAGARVRMLNCEHAANTRASDFRCEADATVLPEFKNVLYFDGSGRCSRMRPRWMCRA